MHFYIISILYSIEKFIHFTSFTEAWMAFPFDTYERAELLSLRCVLTAFIHLQRCFQHSITSNRRYTAHPQVNPFFSGFLLRQAQYSSSRFGSWCGRLPLTRIICDSLSPSHSSTPVDSASSRAGIVKSVGQTTTGISHP